MGCEGGIIVPIAGKLEFPLSCSLPGVLKFLYLLGRRAGGQLCRIRLEIAVRCLCLDRRRSGSFC